MTMTFRDRHRQALGEILSSSRAGPGSLPPGTLLPEKVQVKTRASAGAR